MSRSICPWCFAPADYLDQKTTKCSECIPYTELGEANFLHVQSAEGLVVRRRASEGAAEARRLKQGK